MQAWMSFQVRKSFPSSLAAAFRHISSSMYLSSTNTAPLWPPEHRPDHGHIRGSFIQTHTNLWAYSSSTLLRPVTELDSCFQRAPRSPTSMAWFISTTEDNISTATSSSGWVRLPYVTEAKHFTHVSNRKQIRRSKTNKAQIIYSIIKTEKFF